LKLETKLTNNFSILHRSYKTRTNILKPQFCNNVWTFRWGYENFVLAWNGKFWHGLARFGMFWHGLASFGKEFCMDWPGMASFGMEYMFNFFKPTPF
jgi:hypothetical protein